MQDYTSPERPIDSRQLRYFMAVADHLNFARAAEALHITQPPLSRQIQNLEAQLGVTLFHRNKRRVTLTDAGTALRQGAERVLEQLDELTHITQQVDRGLLGKLTVGFVSTANYSILPTLVRQFRQTCPDIDLQLVELTGDEQLQRLTTGTLDLGLMFDDFSSELSRRRIHQEGYVAALPDGHPLAAQDTALPCSSLAGEPFVFVPRRLAPSLYDTIMGYTRANKVQPRVVQEARQMQTVIGLVAVGVGVSIVPAAMTDLQRRTVRYRPLLPQPPRLATFAVWHPGNTSPVLLRFLRLLDSLGESTYPPGAENQAQ